MKRIFLSLCLLAAVSLNISAGDNYLYNAGNKVLALNSNLDFQMVNIGSEGYPSSCMLVQNKANGTPIVIHYGSDGLPTSISGNGDHFSISNYNGSTADVTHTNRSGQQESKQITSSRDWSNYRTTGLIGALDQGLSNFSSKYGGRMRGLSEICDKLGTAFDIKWTKNFKSFVSSNGLRLAAPSLAGPGYKVVETANDFIDVINGGAKGGLVIGKALTFLLGNYNTLRDSWADFVYDRLMEMDEATKNGRFDDEIATLDWIMGFDEEPGPELIGGYRDRAKKVAEETGSGLINSKKEEPKDSVVVK